MLDDVDASFGQGHTTLSPEPLRADDAARGSWLTLSHDLSVVVPGFSVREKRKYVSIIAERRRVLGTGRIDSHDGEAMV
jgi:hypothetical protein